VGIGVDVDPKGCPTRRQLVYGTSSNYTGADEALEVSLRAPSRHNGGFQNLTPGTLYHFTLVVSNGDGCFGNGITSVTAGDHCFVANQRNAQNQSEVACPAPSDGGGNTGPGPTPAPAPSGLISPMQVAAGLKFDSKNLASQLAPGFASLITDKGAGLITDKGAGINAPAAGVYNVQIVGVISTDGAGLIGQDGAGLRPPFASAKKRRPKVVNFAAGQTPFTQAGSGMVSLKLTRKGKAALKKVRAQRKKLRRQGKRLPKSNLVMRLSFTQPGQPAVVVKRRFKLRR